MNIGVCIVELSWGCRNILYRCQAVSVQRLVAFKLSVVGGGRSWGIGRGGLVGLLLWVDSGTLIGHISDESVISVAGVGHMLDSAVGKSNRVRSLDIAGTIRGLLGVEGGLGVVISNSVGEGVGGLLSEVISLVSSLGWGVGRGRGVVSGGSLDNNWGSVDGVVDWGSVDGVGNNWGGVDSVVHGGNDWGNSVVSDGVRGDGVDGGNSSLSSGDGSVGSDGWLNLSKALGVVGLVDAGVGGTESLVLAQGSDLLSWSDHGLVRDLSSNMADMGNMGEGGVGHKDWASWGGGGNSQEGHAHESLEKQNIYKPIAFWCGLSDFEYKMVRIRLIDTLIAFLTVLQNSDNHFLWEHI